MPISKCMRVYFMATGLGTTEWHEAKPTKSHRRTSITSRIHICIFYRLFVRSLAAHFSCSIFNFIRLNRVHRAPCSITQEKSLILSFHSFLYISSILHQMQIQWLINVWIGFSFRMYNCCLRRGCCCCCCTDLLLNWPDNFIVTSDDTLDVI